MTKALKLTLGDGTELLVREPGAGDLGLFIRAMPAMNLMQKAMLSVDPKQPVVGLVPELPASAMQGLYELLAAVSGLTIEGYNALGVLDGMAVFTALMQLIPSNFTQPTISNA